MHQGEGSARIFCFSEMLMRAFELDMRFLACRQMQYFSFQKPKAFARLITKTKQNRRFSIFFGFMRKLLFYCFNVSSRRCLSQAWVGASWSNSIGFSFDFES
jgi:hypothetical protein